MHPELAEIRRIKWDVFYKSLRIRQEEMAAQRKLRADLREIFVDIYYEIIAR